MNKRITLTCTPLRFYTKNDEGLFFKWIKKINCMDSISGAGDELYLHIASNELHDQDLRDLLALFYRYKIDMKQLKKFLNESNKKWFFDGPQKGYWHKGVFDS